MEITQILGARVRGSYYLEHDPLNKYKVLDEVWNEKGVFRCIKDTPLFLTNELSDDEYWIQLLDARKVAAGAGVQCFANVTEMKNADISEGQLLLTQGYDFPGDTGHGVYIAKTDGTPDGFGNHQLQNDLVAELLGGTLYGETYGILPSREGEDLLDNMEAFCATEKKLEFRNTGMDIYMRDTVFLENISVDLDLGWNTLVSTGANERCLLFINRMLNTYQISDITYTAGYTELTLTAAPTDLHVNQVIKLVSNDIINPRSGFDRQRTAEFLIIEEINGLVVKCRGRHIFPHVDNPRIAGMNMTNTMNLKNVKIRRDLDPTPAEFTVGISINGYAFPRVDGIHTDFWTGQLFSSVNNFNGVYRDVFSKYLLDNAPDNKLGYTGVDYGSQGSKWFNLSSDKCRHVYTTGATSIDADYENIASYGGAVRCHIMSGVGTNCSNFAWDTHQDAFEVEFHDVTAYDAAPTTHSSTGGFQDRAQNTRVHKLTYIADGENVAAGGRAIFMGGGSWNTRVHNFYYRGATGGAIRSFGVEDKKATLTIDYMNVQCTKRIENLVSLVETLTVRIKRLDIIPDKFEQGSYSTSTTQFKVGGGSSLIIDELNYYFDSLSQVNIGGSQMTVCKIQGDGAERVKINVNFHVNANSWAAFGIRTPVVSADSELHCKKVEVNAQYFIEDWPGTMPDTPIIKNITGDEIYSTVKYFNNGKPLMDSSFGKDVHFSTESKLVQGPDAYWNKSNLGHSVDPVFYSRIEAHSGSTIVTELDAPAFEGQRWVVSLSELTNTGDGHPLEISQSATNIRLKNAVTIQPGSRLELIAVERDSGLAWELG